MRELIARTVCLLTLAVVVTLSFVFAARHNPAGGRLPPAVAVPAAKAPAQPSKPVAPDPSDGRVAQGRKLFAEQNCATCHAIEGEGNPRSRLDGVGARLDAAALREWITGTGDAAQYLPAAIVRRKQRYQELPESEMAALVAYLSSVQPAPKARP